MLWCGCPPTRAGRCRYILGSERAPPVMSVTRSCKCRIALDRRYTSSIPPLYLFIGTAMNQWEQFEPLCTSLIPLRFGGDLHATRKPRVPLPQYVFHTSNTSVTLASPLGTGFGPSHTSLKFHLRCRVELSANPSTILPARVQFPPRHQLS